MSAETAGSFMTVPEFARRIGVSERMGYELVERQEVGHHKHGNTIRIPASEVAAYLARTFVPAKPKEAAA